MTRAQSVLAELRHWREMHFRIRLFERRFGMKLALREVAIANMERLAKLLILVLMCGPSLAQHVHPTETITGATAEFYETWKRPDQPNISCCNRMDCYPTEARFSSGHWRAKRREDGAWLTVPASKIEQNRDSPDGRNHLCAPPPGREGSYENGVICFIGGAGG